MSVPLTDHAEAGEPAFVQAPRFEILHADDEIIIIDKPPGLLVHPHPHAPNEPTCIGMLGRWAGRAVHPVHRLDRATSGVMLFARDPDTARELSRRFQEGQVEKRYLAIVRGYLWGAQLLDRAIRRKLDGEERAPARTGLLAHARTEVPHPVGPYDTARYSLVELNLITGRPHQARKHLHHLAHPVVGDKRYGDKAHNLFFQRHLECEEMLLRSMYIEFELEHRADTLRFTAPIPPRWYEIAERIGLELPERYIASPPEAFGGGVSGTVAGGGASDTEAVEL